MLNYHKKLLVFAALLAIYLVAVGIRWHVVATFRKQWQGKLPYTLESALLFRYAEMAKDGGEIPDVDKRAQYPEGLEVKKKLSLGKGIVAAKLYNFLGLKTSFQEFVRRFDAVFFATSVFAIFLLVRVSSAGVWPGLLASALYAVAYPAVVRSTGQEFIRESFALPFIFFHAALLFWAMKKERMWIAVVAGLSAVAAQATWDLTQVYLMVVGIFFGVMMFRGESEETSKMARYFAPTLLFLLAAGFISPYLRFHRFFFSYAILLFCAIYIWKLAVGASLIKRSDRSKIVFLFICFGLIFAWSYLDHSKNYSHFTQLCLAKLRFLNVKPADPEKISFAARILWTPALHSATSKHFGYYPISSFIPFFILALPPTAIFAVKGVSKKIFDSRTFLVTGALIFLLAYILFVRMQVFLIFFLCALAGLGIEAMRRVPGKRLIKVAWCGVAVVILLWQASRYTSQNRILSTMGSGQAPLFQMAQRSGS